MADQPVTKEKLINADIDVENLGKAVNEFGVVNPRYGEAYPTLPSAIQAVIETGGFEPFATETALLASIPTVEKKAAKALDTKKIWYWDGAKWNDTGLSEFDLAKTYTNNISKEIIGLIKKDSFAFYSLSDLNIKFASLSEDLKILYAVSSDGTIAIKVDNSDMMNYADQQIESAISDFKELSSFYTLQNTADKKVVVSENLKIISSVLKNGETVFYKANTYGGGALNLADSEVNTTSDNLLYLQSSVVKQATALEDQDPLYTANFDLVWTNLEEYYKYYDDLMLDYPDYITKEKLGESADPFDIFAYHFTITPKTLLSGLTQDDVKPPHVIITCGVHGNERPAMYSTILFLRNLCRNWKNSELLADLRFGCNITVIPAVNPSGVADTSRLTRRGVDINRNWPNGWVASQTEYGAEPFSELETQVLRDYLLTNIDSVHLDYHAGGDNDSVGFLITDIEPAHTVCLKTLNNLAKWVGQSLEPSDLSMLHGNFSRNAAATINKYMQEDHKQIGACLEALRAANVVGRDIYKTRRMTEMLLIMTVHAFYELVLNLRETKNA